MRLSHSKLSLLLNNPMEYYLSYRMGIIPKNDKPALSMGSAVHWGLEHNTDDLTEYFGHPEDYGHDQLLAEAMSHGYLFHKKQIFDELLKKNDGTELKLVQEMHELYIDAKLQSYAYLAPHVFVGIIDLLLLTEDGFILVDYKTSTNIPDWDSYLDQLYRYIFLLNSKFPEVPVLKIAIINLRKTRTRQTRGESNPSYLNRLKKEYEINDDSLVNWHIFDPNDLNKEFMNNYIHNLSRMADTAQLLDSNNMWFINYAATNSYGGSVYKDIIYHIPDCYVLYNIRDKIYNKYTKEVEEIRSCIPLDMKVVDETNILNKYETFEKEALNYEQSHKDIDKDELFKSLKKRYLCDNDLLEKYLSTYYFFKEQKEN